MGKPVTSLYGDRKFYDDYRQRVHDKLGVSLSARIFELCQKDNEDLGGKANVSPLLSLQNRLAELVRKRLEFHKLVSNKVYDSLCNSANHNYKISFKPPQNAKKAIAAMVQDFHRGRIDEDAGDFQLFIGYLEVTIEYHTVLDAISTLRNSIYSAEALQDTLKAIDGCLDKLGEEGPAMREKLLEAAKAAPGEDAVAKFLRENLSTKGLETLKQLNSAAKKLLEDTKPKPAEQEGGEETEGSKEETREEEDDDDWEENEDEADDNNEYTEWVLEDEEEFPEEAP
jgi:hypothetical protein